MSNTTQVQRIENIARHATLEDTALQYIANNSEDPLELKAYMIDRNNRAKRGKKTATELLGDYYFRWKGECESRNETTRAVAEAMLTEEIDPATGISIKGLFPRRSVRKE
jgi:hypothetical protein